MFTIKELAHKTNAQPYELAAWLNLDEWELVTEVSDLDAIEWLHCCIDTAIGDGNYSEASDLIQLHNKMFCPKLDTVLKV